MNHSIYNLASVFLGAGMVFSVGCASTQSLPGKMKSFVMGERVDKLDPLLHESDELSTEYRAAKKQLSRADDTMMKFARWREDLGDYQEAKDHYRQILADNPDSLNARLGIARIEFTTGRVTEAQAILAATARKHPDSPEVWVEIGRIHSNQEQWDQAIESLEKAVAISPASDPALFKATRYELGLALARNDRAEEARPHLTSAVGSAAALFNIGFVLHEQGRDQEASQWFQRALDAHPDERTRVQSTKMLAKLGVVNGPTETQLVAWPRKQSTVDVSLTSYQKFHEKPGSDATGKNTLTVAGAARSPSSDTISRSGRGQIYSSNALSTSGLSASGQRTEESSRTSSYGTSSPPLWNRQSSATQARRSQSGSQGKDVVAPTQWRTTQ
ncbi:MAG: tetratricopeptide repeat protein [Fuerstiella sp.]|nr:tetratricopeptide repeat protein [Fuerstiella sp.]